MVHGRELAPGVELGDALGHRPPHAPGPREVVGRARVVDAALLRRGDHALERADLGRGCRSGSRRARRRPGRSSPASTRCSASVPCSLRAGSPSRNAIASSTDAPGLDLVRDRLLLGDHARELLDAPLVGLVEVDRRRRGSAATGARRARGRRRRCSPATGCELALEELGERAVRGRRRGGRCRARSRAQGCRQLAVAGRRVRRRTWRRSRRVARVAVRPAPRPRATCRARGDDALARCRRAGWRCSRRSRRGTSPSRVAIARPVVGGVGGHEVEHLADLLRRATRSR